MSDEQRAVTSLTHVRLVAVGSTNPVKLAAARAVISSAAPNASFESIEVPSTVRDQPWGDEETIRGAIARARAARDALRADLGVGLEGGVVELPNGSLRTCAWAAIVDDAGHESIGGSLAMPLPPPVERLVREGHELGHAMDLLMQQRDIKRGAGAVGILTRGLLDRQRAYEPMVVYALSRWLAHEWWTETSDARN
jgi:inosine/xanthosine triphosphatase